VSQRWSRRWRGSSWPLSISSTPKAFSFPLSLEVSSSQQQALALPFAIPFSSSKGPLSIQVGLEVPASFAFEVQVEVPHSRQEEALEVEVWFEVPQVSFAFARQEEGQVCFS